MNKKIFLIISLLALIILVILTNMLIFDKIEVANCGCPKVVSQNTVGIFIIFSIIFTASLFYYLFNLEVDKKKKIITSNINTIFSILDEDEQHLFDLLLKNNGILQQKEIANNFGKIKAHRIIKKLKNKNIIFITKENSQNTVYLKRDLKQVIEK